MLEERFAALTVEELKETTETRAKMAARAIFLSMVSFSLEVGGRLFLEDTHYLRCDASVEVGAVMT